VRFYHTGAADDCLTVYRPRCVTDQPCFRYRGGGRYGDRDPRYGGGGRRDAYEEFDRGGRYDDGPRFRGRSADGGRAGPGRSFDGGRPGPSSRPRADPGAEDDSDFVRLDPLPRVPPPGVPADGPLPAGWARFGGIPVPGPAAEGLGRMGVGAALPIQEAAGGAVYGGDCCLIHAPTGSGKTLSFLLPVVARFAAAAVGSGAGGGAGRGLVLVPTRELALQVQGKKRAGGGWGKGTVGG
jgi:Rad3-related DNA helicase